MPWTLTTPIPTGDLDPTGPYTQVRIVRQLHDSLRSIIGVDLEYGNTINAAWVPGLPVRSRPMNVTVQGTEYSDLIANSMPEEDESTYEAVKRGLYEFLAARNVIGPGTLT
jgi:hypothetical protein